MIIAIDYDLGVVDTLRHRHTSATFRHAIRSPTTAHYRRDATSQNRYTSPYDVTPDFNREITILHLLVFFA